MKVTVIDCSVSGHRETYYKQFAQTWAGMGHETSLIAPRRERCTGDRCLSACLSASAAAAPCRKTVAEKAGCTAQCSDSTAKSVQAAPESSTAESRSGLLCLPRRYAAYIGSLMAIQSFAALSVERPAGSVRPAALPPRDARHPPFPAKQNCVGVGILNEYSAKDLETFQRHILLFPDFADLSAPATNYPLLQKLKEKARGRKVISLLGSINFRKGIKLLLESIPLLPKDEYFFLIAGKSSLTAQQENDLRAFGESRNNCLFSLEKIPDESCFNALIAESDLIFAAYKQFTGSSNLLTKAAAFRKPVIVSRGLCMGRRVEQYGTKAKPPEKTTPENAVQLSARCVPKQGWTLRPSPGTPTNTKWRN